MTVAAVILSASAEGALAETQGQPRVRRLADLAWSGGAIPIVVVSPDPGGVVAAALAGSEAVHGSPAPLESGPAGQMVRGTELAAEFGRDALEQQHATRLQAVVEARQDRVVDRWRQTP